MSLHILQISPEYPPHHIGGGGVVVQDLAQSLSLRNEVTVVSGYYQTRSGFEKIISTYDGSIEVLLLPLIPTPKTRLRLETAMPPNFRSIIYFLNVLFKRRFDIVHLHGFGHLFIDLAAVFCRIAGKPYVLTLHGFPRSPLKGGKMVRFLYRIYRELLGLQTISNAAKVTAVSSAVIEKAVTYGIELEKCTVIPNGVNIEKFREIERSGCKHRFGVGPNESMIVAVGVLHERKGFHYLIKAVGLMRQSGKEVKLLIVGGEGGYAKELEQLTELLGLEEYVTFTGYLNSSEKIMVMKEADIMVIPSLIEPFGLVALEAMAIGKPIIATKVGGLKSILEDGKTALLIEPADSDYLAKTITHLLANASLRKRLSENSRKAVIGYSWKTIADRYLEIYHDIR